jgi:hypothetical protein
MICLPSPIFVACPSTLPRWGGGTAAMPMRSRGAFGPETITEMSEVLDAAFEELQETGEPDVVHRHAHYGGGKAW